MISRPPNRPFSFKLAESAARYAPKGTLSISCSYISGSAETCRPFCLSSHQPTMSLACGSLINR
jgi:hypothetical protein